MKLFFFLTLFLGLAWVLSILAVKVLWPKADETPRGKLMLLHPFRRLAFLFGLVWMSMGDRLQGRRLAINAVMVPFEVDHRGTDNMYPDTGVVIAFRNALVKLSTDDRHFAATSAQADIPRGIILNDQVDAGEANTIKKAIALFGIYPGTLPGVASAAIPASADLVADPANPGQIIALPSASGTYYVIGRARFAVVNAGDPVSIIHTVPRKITQ